MPLHEQYVQICEAFRPTKLFLALRLKLHYNGVVPLEGIQLNTTWVRHHRAQNKTRLTQESTISTILVWQRYG